MAHQIPSQRLLRPFALLLTIITLLSACGNAAPSTTVPTAASSGSVAATSAPEMTTAPAATAAPVATEAVSTAAPEVAPAATAAAELPPVPAANAPTKKYKGTLVVANNGVNPSTKPALDALAAAYKQVQPDVEVLFEGPPNSEPGTYDTWLGTQLAAGEPRPDIVSGNYQATYGKYVNLDQYRFQTNQYTGNTWDQDLDWNFYIARNAKGERIMLPSESVHIMWFYNKDLFAKAGVQPPTNWDELVSASEKLQAAGITPIASNFVWKVPQWVYEIYNDQYVRDRAELVRAQPGDFNYDEDLDGKFSFDVNSKFLEATYTPSRVRYLQAIRDGKIKFNTPETVELVTNLSKVFPKYASKSLFVDTTDYSEFLQGQVAMIIDGSWSLPGLARDMQNINSLTAEQLETLKIEDASGLKAFEWGTFENPPMTGGLVKAPVRSVESASGVYGSVINKDAEQTAMAVDFLMFWLSAPGHQAYINGALASPAGYSPAGPIKVSGVTLPANLQAPLDNLTAMGNAENGFTGDIGLGVAELDTQVKNMYKEALEGKITPEQFAANLQKMYDDNFQTIVEKSGLTMEDIDSPERAPGE